MKKTHLLVSSFNLNELTVLVRLVEPISLKLSFSVFKVSSLTHMSMLQYECLFFICNLFL